MCAAVGGSLPRSHARSTISVSASWRRSSDVSEGILQVAEAVADVLQPTENVSLREILQGVTKVLPRVLEVVLTALIVVVVVTMDAMVVVVMVVMVAANSWEHS